VLIASADFAWYLSQLGLSPSIVAWLTADETRGPEPFPGATTTPAAVFLTVATFAVMQLAAAFIATRVAGFVRRREEHALHVAEQGADTLPAQALEAIPASSVTVIAATAQIVHASKRFTQQMLLHNDPVIGRELPSLLAFDDPDELRTLLDDGGSLPQCRYRVGAEERTARVSVTRFEHDGTQYANVLIEDEPADARSLAVALLLVLMLCVPAARAQDALVVSANADRLEERNGGGASVMWIHPRANGNLFGGGTFLSLADARWAYATAGLTRSSGTRTTLTGEANLGSGRDDGGDFHYVLLRAGVTRELAPRMHAEAEWLQVDVARRQDGIIRIGGTFVPQPRLTVRASLFQSVFGDDDVTLGTVRADYDIARVTAIAGVSAGTAVPALLQQTDIDAGRVREVFGGVAFKAAAQRWTLILSSRDDHQRLSLTCRLPLR
jgi:hypothetical protein